MTELKGISQLVKEQICLHLKEQLPTVLLDLICSYEDDSVLISLFGLSKTSSLESYNLRFERTFSLTEWIATCDDPTVPYINTINRFSVDWNSLYEYYNSLNILYDVKVIGGAIYCLSGKKKGIVDLISKWNFIKIFNKPLKVKIEYSNSLPSNICNNSPLITVVNDRWLWFIGGFSENYPNSSILVYKYDINTKQWEICPSLLQSHYYSQYNHVAVSNGFICVIYQYLGRCCQIIDTNASLPEWKLIGHKWLEGPFRDIFVRNNYFYLCRTARIGFTIIKYSTLTNSCSREIYNDDDKFSKCIYSESQDRLFLISFKNKSKKNISSACFDINGNLSKHIIKVKLNMRISDIPISVTSPLSSLVISAENINTTE